MVQPDNFSLYQPLVVAALWMGARGLKGSPRAFIAGRPARGARDAVAQRRRPRHGRPGRRLPVVAPAPRPGRARGIPWSAAVACVAVFALVMAPWWARQLAVFGSISPSTASGKVLFIRSIEEWNSITIPASLEHLFGMGLAPLLATRVQGLVDAIVIFSVLVGGVVLVPFMVVGAWRRRRSVDFGPYFLYAGFLFAFSAAGQRGPRPGRHVHPQRRRARPARLHPRARGHRPRGRGGRGTPAVLGRRHREPHLRRRGDRVHDRRQRRRGACSSTPSGTDSRCDLPGGRRRARRCRGRPG